MGWQWTFYFVAIFTGASLPLMIFLVPETAFRRPDYLNTDYEDRAGPANGNATDSQLPLSGVAEDGDAEELKGPSMANQAQSDQLKTSSHSGVPKKDSYLMTLRPFNGRKTDENFFKLLLRPLPLFLHPGILWVSSLHDVDGCSDCGRLA